MPEGHTIHRLAREHMRALAGQALRVSSPQGRHPVLAARLDQHRLADVAAYGKHLFYRWCDAPILHVHLGLFGRFNDAASPPPAPGPSVQLRIAGPAHTVDLIGATTCELLEQSALDRLLARLGPDLLAETPDPELAWQRLQRRRTPIGAALLDQQILSGVGNVYRLEALFVNGIHPERAANTLRRVEFDALWHTLRDMLRRGVEDRRIVTVHPSERTSSGSEAVPLDEAFYVYHQSYCKRCGSPIRSWRLGARTAWACERCQPPPD